MREEEGVARGQLRRGRPELEQGRGGVSRPRKPPSTNLLLFHDGVQVFHRLGLERQELRRRLFLEPPPSQSGHVVVQF